MADTKAILKRCGERVTEARLLVSSHVFGSMMLLQTEGSGGLRVEAMATHPWGLAVQHKGARLIVPGSHVEFAKIASDEG